MFEGFSNLGDAKVISTSGRGMNVEEVASLALDKIISVAQTAPEPIRQQAEAYRESIKIVLQHYMKQAIKSDRTTLFNQLTKAGQFEAANIVMKDL